MGCEPIFSLTWAMDDLAAGIVPIHYREELGRSPLHKLQEQGTGMSDYGEVRRGKVRKRRKPGVGRMMLFVWRNDQGEGCRYVTLTDRLASSPPRWRARQEQPLILIEFSGKRDGAVRQQGGHGHGGQGNGTHDKDNGRKRRRRRRRRWRRMPESWLLAETEQYATRETGGEARRSRATTGLCLPTPRSMFTRLQ